MYLLPINQSFGDIAFGNPQERWAITSDSAIVKYQGPTTGSSESWAPVAAPKDWRPMSISCGRDGTAIVVFHSHGAHAYLNQRDPQGNLMGVDGTGWVAVRPENAPISVGNHRYRVGYKADNPYYLLPGNELQLLQVFSIENSMPRTLTPQAFDVAADGTMVGIFTDESIASPKRTLYRVVPKTREAKNGVMANEGPLTTEIEKLDSASFQMTCLEVVNKSCIYYIKDTQLYRVGLGNTITRLDHSLLKLGDGDGDHMSSYFEHWTPGTPFVMSMCAPENGYISYIDKSTDTISTYRIISEAQGQLLIHSTH